MLIILQWITRMKLFYDARYIRTDFHDGISRYSTELGNALAKLTDVTFIISDPKQREFLPKNANFVKINSVTSPKELYTARTLNKYQPDVVFSPFQTMGASGRKFKLILTLHDLIFYRHRMPPKDQNPIIRLGWWLYHTNYVAGRFALNRADMVATVSTTVAREIEDARLTKRPVIVVPNAPQKLRELVTEVRHIGVPKNIVYMGTFMPYKNVETIIKGMKWLPGRTLHLLSRISPERKAELQKLIPKGANVIFYGGVSDQQYADLLADNAILVTASLDEGYGIPVAEALAMGVPAVISNIAIFHEVGGGGALYFSPHKPKEFAQQVMVLDNKAKRDEIIAAGLAHMKTFSWDSSARTLLNAIKSLM